MKTFVGLLFWVLCVVAAIGTTLGAKEILTPKESIFSLDYSENRIEVLTVVMGMGLFLGFLMNSTLRWVEEDSREERKEKEAANEKKKREAESEKFRAKARERLMLDVGRELFERMTTGISIPPLPSGGKVEESLSSLVEEEWSAEVEGVGEEEDLEKSITPEDRGIQLLERALGPASNPVNIDGDLEKNTRVTSVDPNVTIVQADFTPKDKEAISKWLSEMPCSD
jgi:hypothetical protein